MIEFSTVMMGALTTIAAFFVNMIVEKYITGALKTAVKALMTLVIAFGLACLQLLFANTFTWPGLWQNLPVVIASAMTIYGLILKPITKDL